MRRGNDGPGATFPGVAQEGDGVVKGRGAVVEAGEKVGVDVEDVHGWDGLVRVEGEV